LSPKIIAKQIAFAANREVNLLPIERCVKRNLWAIIAAYMLGLHNFYIGEDKTPDDMGIIVDVNEVQEDCIPNN
jgi:hypothetical protein